MSRPHVAFDGYSYEPPSYEEAQLNQSVYKPTVSQDTTFAGGLRPLYTPNGYSGFEEYNRAKKRRRMRIACATILGVLGFILFFVIVFWEINLKHRYDTQSYKSSDYNLDYNNNENLSPYSSYNKDSSIFKNDGYYGEPTIDDKQLRHLNDDVLENTETDDNKKINDQLENTANNFGWVADARREFEKLKKEDFGDVSVDKDEQNPFISNTDPDKLFGDIDAFVKRKIEKLNLNSVASNSNSHTSINEENYEKDSGEEKPTTTIANSNEKSSKNPQSDKSTTEAANMDTSTRRLDLIEGLDELYARKKDIPTDAELEEYVHRALFGKRKK